MGLNFHSIKSLINKSKGNLIADFMLIPAHGNNFVYPYNPIYNYNEHCYQNCLVIMFICFESEGRIYPIVFDYWISEIYYDEDEHYLSKNDVFINSIEYLIKQGLNIETILFDAAFFNRDVLNNLSLLNINIVTRCPKSRVLHTSEIKQKAKDMFSSDYNGEFYYYHGYQSFFKSKNVQVFNLSGQVVAIANNKENLVLKKLFFLFTTNLNLSAVSVLRLYKRRWKIESFFKLLKSYLSLSVFYRNDYDYVNQRINLALAGFIVIQEMAYQNKISFYQALKLFQQNKHSSIFNDIFLSHSKYFCNYV